MPNNHLHFGYVVVFVPDVEQAVAFYEKAFGIRRRMVTPMFAQMETGATALAFGAETNEERELGGFTYSKNRLDAFAAGLQISFVAEDVASTFQRAIESGCTPVVQPKQQPWGQTVSRVRDLNGVLVSIVSPFKPPPQ